MYKICDYEKKSKKIIIIKKIFSSFLYIIIIPILFINFTFIVKAFINPDKIPDFCGYKSFIIVSESMKPTLNVKDAIFVKSIDENMLEVHDIISFHDGDDINTHRIIGIINNNGKREYITKGDNNKNEDKERISYDKIEGKYVFRIKYFGFFVKWIQSKVTLILLIIFMIIDINYTRHLKKKKERRRKKRQECRLES